MNNVPIKSTSTLLFLIFIYHTAVTFFFQVLQKKKTYKQ